MMRMKHLLKKLHIGGGGGGTLDDLRTSNLPTIPPPTSSSSSTAAMVGSGDRLSRGTGLARDSVGSRAMRGSSVGADGTLEDFSFFEEEYQVQLALAISVSDQDGRDDVESAQINAAKRMSLGFAPVSGGESLVEILSQRYWNFNVLNYDEKVMDGFYDVYGIIDSSIQERMPLLVDLRSATIADNVNHEVVVVNRTTDLALRQLETTAVSISTQCRAMGLADPSESGLIQKIAKLVVDSMGGPVIDANDMLKRWTLKNYELRTSLNTIVLPLGCLSVGLSRHRALLFKVLADRIGLPCKLVKGSYYTGTDEGAVNLIKIDDEKEYIIDLMGAPGTLIPAEIPSCLFQNAEFDLINSSSITQAIKDLSLVPDGIADWQLDGRRGVNGLSIDAYSGSKSVGSMAEENLKLGLRKRDSTNIEERKDTERFKHDFGKLLPLSKTQGKTSGSNQHEAPAQKMEVSDASKYAVSAAKNPEFTQQLQAALLESGTPADPFSNVNCLDGNEFQKNLDQELETSEEIDPHHGNFSPRGNVHFLPSSESELSGCGSKTTHMQKEATIQNIKGHHSESAYKNEEFLLHNICVTEMIQDSSSSFVPGVANDANALDGMQIHQEVESSKTDLGNPISGMPLTIAEGITKNKEITAVLDEVAECEIPWDDLAIGERIGIGSYGEVYHADWNGTEVAVKKFLEQDLSGDALEQFKCEIKIMLRLRHPNVVLFMGAVTRAPNLSILTEFLPRGSLYKLLHRSKVQIDEKQRLRMALDVAKGMNYLHTSHPTIVHRDLKSPNLLVDKNWVVKVCDFGLSRLKHHTFLSSKSTAGTPEWMAPEVLRNERSNEKCDVYSFGIILWELATLRIPWSGMNPMQVVGAVGFQNRRLEIPKEVDPLVVDIICKCWHNDPDERPSFAQLMGQLKKLDRLAVEIS